MSKAARPELICLGEPLAEFNQQPDGTYLHGFGGDTSNCAIAAVRHGASVGFITCLGDDFLADGIRELLEQEGINTCGVRMLEHASTGIYFVTHDPARGHAFSYRRAGSASSQLEPSHLDRELLAACQWLHVSGISQAISASACAAVDAAIAIVKEHGGSISYDSNLRLKLWSLEEARAAFEATVPQCDLLLPSLEDAQQLTGLQDAAAIVEHCLALGPATVCMSQGADGCMLGTASGVQQLPAVRLDAIVDATAAGDTFDGALLAELIAGTQLEDAIAYANRAAALSTQKYGAVNAIPSREELEASGL